MSNTELNLFKDEVLNEIREMEKKFLNELSNKNFEHTINYETFSEKVNSILESNRLMIESITNQKIHFEKINKLEKEAKKMDQNIITHEIRINNILNEISKMTTTYDKLISSNLIIPGYIGPGCSFKSFGDFVINSINEFRNFKDDKENIKRQNNELKTKIDVIVKNLTNFIEFNANRCKSYTDSKEKDYNLKLENKFHIFDEKTIETNQKILNKQIKFEEQLKEIGLEIDKFYDVREDINSLIKEKFEKVNEREEEINKRLLNATYEVRGLTDQLKNIYLKIENLDRSNNLKFEEQNKINQRIFKLSKSNNFNLYNNKKDNFELKKITYDKNEISKKNGLPLNLTDSSNINNLTNIDKSKISKNEKISSTLFSNLKPEDRKENFNTEDKISNDISLKSLKSSSNRKEKGINYIRNIIDASVSRSSRKKTDLFPKRKISVNEIKERKNRKNKSNIYINLKGNKKKIIFDNEVKEELTTNIEHLDKPKNDQIKIKSKNKAVKMLAALNYDNSYFVKTTNDFYKNPPKIMINKEAYTRYMSLNKPENKKDIIKQRNKYNGDSQKELIRNIKTENSYFDGVKKVQSSNRSINPVDCNLINLNLQDLPNNKNKNQDDDDSNQNLSFEFNQNKKKASKSNDSKSQIKVLTFGKTTNTFFKKNNNL